MAKATTVNVVMKENAVSLEDVVVVGYGVQKKVNVTGAVSMVKAEAIENRPITNVTTGLQGLLPGVSIVSSSGQPGAVPNINIRGTGTINSSTAPLILIDGVAGETSAIESFGYQRISVERCRVICYLWSACRQRCYSCND